MGDGPMDIEDGNLTDSSCDDAVLTEAQDDALPDSSPGKVDLFETLGGMLLVYDSDESENSSQTDREEEGETGVVPASCTIMRSVRRRLMNVTKWERLLALLCLDGRGTFTEKQFNTMRRALMERDRSLKIPDPRTVKNSLRRSMLLHCFPKSEVTFIKHNMDANMFSATAGSSSTPPSTSTSPQDGVRLVLPSEWAKLDVACLPFYQSVFPEQLPNCRRSVHDMKDVNVEDSLIVRDRDLALQRRGVLRAKFPGTHATWHVSQGDLISFPCSRSPALHDNDVCGWHEWETSAGGGKQKKFFVQGRTDRTFGVGFARRDAILFDGDETPPMPASYVSIVDAVYEELRVPNRSIDSDPRAVHSNQRTLPCRSSVVDLDLFPGDVITFMRPTDPEITEGMCCVFHTSPVSASRGRAAERLIWLCVEATNGAVSAMSTIASTNVIGMPQFLNDGKLDDISKKQPQRSKSKNAGVLPNGDRYIVYRAALYGDGFQQNRASPQSKSVAGVYMLPLGLPVSERTSAHAVRVLCLTPHGISVSNVMNRIIDDVCDCAKYGVTGMDPLGRKVIIFLDIVNMIGDYPQVAKYTDVLGHSADAMCALCVVRKRKNRPLPVNNYSNDIHAGRVGYLRFDGRRNAIRAGNPHQEVLRVLGMQHDDSMEVNLLPAVYLSNRLSAAADELARGRDETVRRTRAQHPTPLMFDHALSVPAVPDHLLSIMVSAVMSACFKSMNDDETRRVTEMRIVNAASSNGMEVKHHVANWEKGPNGPRFKNIASNTMSAWLCILLVAAPIFEELHALENRTVYLLPRKLQTFVSVLYKWPKQVAEGRLCDAWDFGKVQYQVRYQHNAASTAIAFLSAAREEYVKDKSVGATLDRPMTHRLLELVMSTIPTYGHALLCSELILEHTHQLFKRWLVQNTHTDAHLTGMERAIGRDWMWRLSSMYRLWKDGDASVRSQADVGLRRILMGEEGMRIGGTSRNGVSITTEMHAALLEAMRVPVPELLIDCDDMNASRSACSGYAWSAMWDDEARLFDPICDGMIDQVVATRDPEDIDLEDLHFFKRARYMQRDGVGPQRSYRYNVIECGDAISAIVAPGYISGEGGTVVRTVIDGSGDCRYFVVGGIIGNLRTDDVWVVCKELVADGPFFTCIQSMGRYLKLDIGCRRVALIHRCVRQCVRGEGRAQPEHHETCLGGGKYYVLDRARGYPPFQG